MIWFSLDELIEGVVSRGLMPIAVNDPGCLVFKSPQKSGAIHPKVVFPMNQGDWLPEPVVRKLLAEVEFDVDEFLQGIRKKTE